MTLTRDEWMVINKIFFEQLITNFYNCAGMVMVILNLLVEYYDAVMIYLVLSQAYQVNLSDGVAKVRRISVGTQPKRALVYRIELQI